MWCTEPALRGVCLLVGGGFLVYSGASAVTGWFYDSDDGWIERAKQPVSFWMSIVATASLGLLILGVGFRWPAVEALIRRFEARF